MMGEVGTYWMLLSCDNKKNSGDNWTAEAYEHDKEWEYTGESRAECVRQARRDGWIVNRNTNYLCPACSGKKDGN